MARRAPAPVFGVLTVSCPDCRAVAGRACVDPRGYLARETHWQRRESWRAVLAAAE